MPEQGSQHNTVTQPMRPAEVSREECEAILNPALPTSAEVVERLARAHLELLDQVLKLQDRGVEINIEREDAQEALDELRSQNAALESNLSEIQKLLTIQKAKVSRFESQLADSQARIDALESEMNPHDIQRVDSQLRAAGALRAKLEAKSEPVR